MAYIRGEKNEGLNIVKAGTNHGERTIVAKKNASELSRKLGTKWIYQRGAPK